jgi:hypothetical protein
MTEKMLQRPCTSRVPASLDGSARVHHVRSGRYAASLRTRAAQRNHVAAHDAIERLASGNTDVQDEVGTVILSAVVHAEGTELHTESSCTNLNILCLREWTAVPEQEVSALVALEGREMHVLLEAAGAVRDAGHRVITFSPKVASQPLSAYQLYAQFSRGSGSWLRRPGVLAAHAALPRHVRLLHLCAAAGARPARVHGAAGGAGRRGPRG